MKIMIPAEFEVEVDTDDINIAKLYLEKHLQAWLDVALLKSWGRDDPNLFSLDLLDAVACSFRLLKEHTQFHDS